MPAGKQDVVGEGSVVCCITNRRRDHGGDDYENTSLFPFSTLQSSVQVSFLIVQVKEVTSEKDPFYLFFKPASLFF